MSFDNDVEKLFFSRLHVEAFLNLSISSARARRPNSITEVTAVEFRYHPSRKTMREHSQKFATVNRSDSDWVGEVKTRQHDASNNAITDEVKFAFA